MDFKDPLDDAIDSEQYVDVELISWVKQRITLAGFLPEMWKEDFNTLVTEFLSSKSVNKLLLFIVRASFSRCFVLCHVNFVSELPNCIFFVFSPGRQGGP